MYYDPRFISSGLTTTVYNIQSENEVLAMLEDCPNYSTEVNSNSKKKDKVYSWNRPTINWSLLCEDDGKGRGFAYEIVNSSITSSEKLV